jgi:hypothetical protein
MAEKENGKANTTKPLCFVVGPIGKDGSPERKHADMMLNAVIKHVLTAEEFGYRVKRADEDSDPGMIGDRMISDVINAELVVADLTDLNPNAFYELGIRHSTEKPTIHIARSGTALPFDTIAHRTIFVDVTDWHSSERGRADLAKFARAIKSPDYKVSNPITRANASFKMRQSADPKDQVIADMAEEMEALKARFANIEGSVAIAQMNSNAALGIPTMPDDVQLIEYRIFDDGELVGFIKAPSGTDAIQLAIKEYGIPERRWTGLRASPRIERRASIRARRK